MKAPGPSDIAISEDNFPDKNFRENYVKRYDDNNDDFLNENELLNIERLSMVDADSSIADLHGLEYFKYLTELVVEELQLLNKVDVSRLLNLGELTVFQTAVSEITFGDNSFLSFLACPYNKLTSVDVSSLNNLVDCSFENNQLTNLTLGKHPLLRSLSCNNNLLSTLSPNQCENLECIICNDNQLTTLDLSNNLKLSEIDISNNALTELDLSHNPELDFLWCSNNHLTSLDLSKNPKISARYFKGEHQTYSIEVDQDTLEFDLSSLPGNFIPARARKWVGASVSGMTLNLDPSMPATVTYNYDADPDREGFIMDVTLFVTYVSKDILIPCPYGAVICPTQPAYQTIPLTPVPVQQIPGDNIQGQVAQLPKTGEQDSKAVALGSLLLLSLGAFFMISRRK